MTNDRDSIDMQVAGLVVRLSVLWGLDFLPILPLFLIYALTGNFDGATKPEVIRLVAPGLAER